MKTVALGKENIVIAICMFLGPISAQSTQAQESGPGIAVQNRSPRFRAGALLLGAKPGIGQERIEKLTQRHGAKFKKTLGRISVHFLRVPEGAEDAVAAALSSEPDVEFVEKDELHSHAFAVNDPEVGSQWHLSKIQASSAWDYANGGSLVIAILDSGVDSNHPELSANMLPGWNVVLNSADSSDINGHGTAVAGSAAAVGNNGAAIASVAWGAKILPIRVAYDSSGSAYTSDLAEGLTYAADHGAKVANMSYAVCGSSTVKSAAQYFQSKGGNAVASAGNQGTNLGYALNPYILCVSATDGNDANPSWSNYGNYVGVAAPGVGIYTTGNGGGYVSWSGTSFSSPIVAGVVALVRSANPNVGPVDAQNIMMSSADDLGAAGYDIYYGWGRVNAAKAVAAAKSFTGPDVTPPTVSITFPSSDLTVTGVVPVTVSVSDNVSVAKVELWINGKLYSTQTASPYAFSWDSSAQMDGSATLQAIAYDGSGNKGSSSVLSVTTDNGVKDTIAPSVTISKPLGGARIGKSIQTISATGADNLGVVTMKLLIDNVLKATFSGSSLSYSWSTKSVAAGSHVIQVIATDAAGNSGSASVTVKK